MRYQASPTGDVTDNSQPLAMLLYGRELDVPMKRLDRAIERVITITKVIGDPRLLIVFNRAIIQHA